MSWLRRPSIGRRLVLALLVACVLEWLGIYGLGRLMVYTPVTGSFDMEMRSLSLAAVEVIERHSDRHDHIVAALSGLSAKIGRDEDYLKYPAGFLAFQVHARDGRLIAEGGLLPDEPLRATGGHADDGYFDAMAGGSRYRGLRSWTRGKAYRVDVVQSIAAREENYDGIMFSREGLVQPLLVSFPLLLLPLWIAGAYALKPLRELSAELASRHPEDLEPLRTPAVYSEFAGMVSAMNATLARLDALLSRERQFLADAAHELRTPLAVVAVQCDTLVHADSAAQREAAAARMATGLARASRLVNQLLTLARLDSGLPCAASAADVADIVRDSLAFHAGPAALKRMQVSYHGPDSVPGTASLHALESIVDNLVGNAVRYGRPGGRVEVRIEKSDASGIVTLMVLDDGPGIPAESRPRMFERFHRGEHAGASGSGLGLAIVRAAVRQLHGEIDTADGLDGKGIAFQVRWRPSPAKA